MEKLSFSGLVDNLIESGKILSALCTFDLFLYLFFYLFVLCLPFATLPQMFGGTL